MLFTNSIIAVVAVFVAGSNAISSANFTSPYTLVSSSVPGVTRDQWCLAQRNTCTQLCNNKIDTNTCDSSSLSWECDCTGGNTPNITDFSQSLAALECTEWKTRCVAAAPNDLSSQKTCLAVECGNKNASSYSSGSSSTTSSSSTSSSSPTATANANDTSNDSSNETAPSGNDNSAAFRTTVPSTHVYGMVALIGAMGAVFGLFL